MRESEGSAAAVRANSISSASLDIACVCVQSRCLFQAMGNMNQSILRFALLLPVCRERKHLYSNKILSRDWREE